MSDNWMRRQVSKRMTAWSRTTMPGWWTAFMVVCGLVFFSYLGYSMMTSDSARTSLPAPAAAPSSATSPDSSDNGGSTPGSTSPGDAVPTSRATSRGADLPRTTSGPEAAASVPGPGGKPTRVSRPALDTVTLAFRSLFDPAAARQVRASDGSTLQPPLQASNGTVSRIRLSPDATTGPDRLRFTAAVDPDGAGPIPAADIPLTVARTGSGWVLVLTP